LLELIIDEEKNGLDEGVIRFEYQVTEFNDQKVEVQLDFECAECISSFETDIMTITGKTKDKVFFIYDVELPPQVDKDYFLTEIIEFGAFVTVCVMGGTIVLALLLDLTFFFRFKYRALWQAVEIWQ